MASRLKRRIPIIFGGSGGAIGLSTAASIGRMLRWGIGAAAGAASSAYVGSFISGGSGGFTRETGFDISGTLTDGQSVTITDTQSRFGTKPFGGKPWMYIPMSGSYNPDPAYSRGTSSNLALGGATGLATFSTDEVSPSGGTGVLRSPKDDSGGSWGCRVTNGFGYVFTHRRYNWPVLTDGILSNLKSFRVHTNISAAQPPRTSFIFALQDDASQTITNSTVELITTPTGGTQNGYLNLGGARALLGVSWHRFELEFQASSGLGVADGVLCPWLNGARPTSGGGSGWKPTAGIGGWTTANSTYNLNLYNDMRFDQISSNVEPDGAASLHGPTLIDDSRCRVIVSDEATWNTINTVYPVRDFCVTDTWAAGSITFLLRQGLHSTLSGKYLYVVKSDGSALKIGRFT
jgi:hypothetical protein